MLIRSIQATIAFLTIIPGPKSYNHDLKSVANAMHLFPVAGLLIGAIIGCLAYLIWPYLQPLITAFIVTSALSLLTGLHHTDALADFTDGLMTKGEKAAKRNAMCDPAVGSAGAMAIILYAVGMIVALSSFHHGIRLLTSIISAEVIAKYIMVIQAHKGISAWSGFSSPFTVAMKDRRKMIIASIISILAILFFGSGYFGIIALIVSLAVAALIQFVSNQSFGGISGDVMGASNEITRLSSLVVLSGIMP